VTKIAEAAHAAGALLIVVFTEAVSLGLLKSPGEMGADIAVGEGQSIGNALNFGGPYVGLFACQEKYRAPDAGPPLRRDRRRRGQRGFVLTLSTREQHIRRDKATSNICTNSGLCVLAFTIHMTLLGEAGPARLAEDQPRQCAQARRRSGGVNGVEVLNAPLLQRIHREAPRPAGRSGRGCWPTRACSPACRSRASLPGAGLDDLLLVANTETNTDDDRGGLRGRADAKAKDGCEQHEPSGPSHPSGEAADTDDPSSTFTGQQGALLQDEAADLRDRIAGTRPASISTSRTPSTPRPRRAWCARARSACPASPSPRPMRHYVRLSQKNHGIDLALYPLGSCTMKHNPRLNEKMARLPGFADVHPLQPVSTCRARSTLMAALALAEDADRHACGGAVAQGRRAWRALRPDGHQGRHRRQGRGRDPPPSCWCRIRPRHQPGHRRLDRLLGEGEIAQTDDGRVDLEDVKAKLGPDVAAIMLTNPNTCGLFERDIVEIARLMHEAGAYFYCDGANFNAIVGRVRPGDLGVDAMHINLHKTFSTPHGGGGPGAGPVVLSAALAPFAPCPLGRGRRDSLSSWSRKPSDQAAPFGRITAFHGQMGMFVRAYAYMLSHGADGLKQVAEDAVLNANYIKARLST
jgi:glycine dehydrogenase subunit 2